jgi:hypothetical protein
MQTRELEEFCQRRGWHITGRYVDQGVSGAKDSRPELNRLMADAHSRSVSHLLRALETFQALGIEFVSLSEQIDTSTPTGKMVFTILGAVAWRRHSRRIRETRNRRISNVNEQPNRCVRARRYRALIPAGDRLPCGRAVPPWTCGGFESQSNRQCVCHCDRSDGCRAADIAYTQQTYAVGAHSEVPNVSLLHRQVNHRRGIHRRQIRRRVVDRGVVTRGGHRSSVGHAGYRRRSHTHRQGEGKTQPAVAENRILQCLLMEL